MHKNIKEIYGKCYYGIKTGFNEAFILNENINDESDFIKPALEGKDIKKWVTSFESKYIIVFENGWTKKEYGDYINEEKALELLKKDHPIVINHLLEYKNKLKERYDQGEFWWELRQCTYYDLLNKPKIIFPNLQVKNKFSYDNKNKYLIAPAVFLPNAEMDLIAILNSKLIWFYLINTCVSRKGGYYEIKPQYFEKIPIAKYNNKIKKILKKYSKSLIKNKKRIQEIYNINFYQLINKYSSQKGISLERILKESNFNNNIYIGRARKVRDFKVNINTNIITLYSEKSSNGRYELLKFEENNEYKRRFFKYYLENLTEKQLEE